MKENFKLGGILLIITMIAGLLLGFANDLTKEAIIENSKISKEDLSYIMPEAEKIQDMDIELDAEGNVKEIYEAVSGSDVIGYVLKVTSKGFHGAVDFVVAISKDDTVSGVKVLSHSETPGLGAKISEDKFISRFEDKPATGYLEVVKVTPNKDTEVEAISGATTSSKAAVNAVNEAITFYLEKIKGEVVESKEDTDANTGASEN
ncbi:RnfABCDGE type electron transport complex subunit G [Clostridium nigeriense]|uniref:RnfABCDGE type electron transport complex subunit G n=1 Tax=Clostridium nigeriense TaxID=1805470 RepID=UPI003D32E7EE